MIFEKFLFYISFLNCKWDFKSYFWSNIEYKLCINKANGFPTVKCYFINFSGICSINKNLKILKNDATIYLFLFSFWKILKNFVISTTTIKKISTVVSVVFRKAEWNELFISINLSVQSGFSWINSVLPFSSQQKILCSKSLERCS